MFALHQGLLDEELQHLKEALLRCKYPRWAINKVQNKVLNGNQEEQGNTQVNNTMQDNSGPSDSNKSQATTTSGARPNAGCIVIPYIQGLGESIKCICLKYGKRTHFKGNRTIKFWSSLRTRTQKKRRMESSTAISVQL